MKALFTSVPVNDAIKAIKKAIQNVPQDNFPVPKTHFLKLVELCLDFQVFSFNGEQFSQIHGLAMGSPLSPVAACLYMEMMEEDYFFNIMGESVIWYRYIDDVIIVAPSNIDLDEKLARLNDVENKIQFTIEREQADSLPFLDIQIIKRPNGAKYKVYRKVTNKEDYIHYFSAHSKRIKSGVVIGFFLRAMRIRSEEYLEDECEHIRQSFLNLKYPRAFIVDCYNKAKRVKARVRTNQEEKPKERIIVVPRSQHSEVISRSIRRTGIRVVEKSGEKIGQLVAAPKTQNKSSNSLV